MERKISEKELELMQLFVQITNTPARDIIEGDTFVIFIVSKGMLQQALQKGLTLLALRNKLQKQVEGITGNLRLKTKAVIDLICVAFGDVVPNAGNA